MKRASCTARLLELGGGRTLGEQPGPDDERIACDRPRRRDAQGQPRAWYPAGVEYTPEILAMLEAQRQHFASDDHIRREVEAWRDATPPFVDVLMKRETGRIERCPCAGCRKSVCSRHITTLLLTGSISLETQ